MRNTFSTLIALGVCSILALGTAAQAQEKKANPTGTWTWTTPGRDGGPERKSTLTLKLAGDKLTGKISSPGRDGQARETEIADGTVKGDEVAFTVTREYNGNKMVSKYAGKVTAETIKGKISFDRDGQTQSRDWEAKRVVEKK